VIERKIIIIKKKCTAKALNFVKKEFLVAFLLEKRLYKTTKLN